MAAPEITYDAHVISHGIDLTVTGSGTQNITASYTDRTAESGTPPSTDMAYGHVNIQYANVNWTLNNDNSVTVTGTISDASFRRDQAYSGQTYYQYEIWFTFNGQETFRTVVQANEAMSKNRSQLGIPSSFSVTVQPRSTSDAAGIFFHSKSVGYSYDPDEFVTGIRIFNPNYPDYRPGQCLHSGTWKSHNRSGGSANILVNGTWTEMRTTAGDNNNPPLIRRSNSWTDQAKIGDET